jgi:hypothetical protein
MPVKNTLLLLAITCILTSISLSTSGQTFTMNTTLLAGTYNSGGCTGVCDMNNDGLDDIVILDESRLLSIAYQVPGSGFTISYFGAVSNEAQWGMCIGDIDNDGHKDVMCGGAYDDVHIVNIDGPGVFNVVDYPWAAIFTQGCNLADIDSDGFLDGFLCHDDGHNMILHNNGAGGFTNGQSMIDMVFYPETNGNDNSGNYGSVWTDFDRDGDTDLFIAKCRQFISDPFDPRRTNVLVINNGDGTFDHTNPITGVSYAQERGLVNLEQSWTSDFADVDNDGDFDCLLTTHSNTLEIYENDGNGFFTNRTQGSGLQFSGFFLQAKLHDFDNDGFVDLIHAGGNHDYYHNDGDFTFTRIQNTFMNNDVMHSFGIGDLNNDGYLDVYASYGDGYVDADNAHPDRIFINNGGTNNWIDFDLQGINSNTDGVGAIVEITGAFGTQIREVRAGESYGITNTFTCHFGIGSATSIDQAIVYWPSGLQITVDNPVINSVNSISENTCSIAPPSIAVTGNTVLCPGESVTLSATTPGLSYTWNTGQIGNSIIVSEAGNYFVNATNASGCNGVSAPVAISMAPAATASIFPANDLYICQGNSVVLTASSGQGYLWSNGATGQSIVASQSGNYSVSVLGECSSATSEVVAVNVIPVPNNPIVPNVEVGIGQPATFSTTGATQAAWYNSPNAIIPLATGSSFTTAPLSQTTSFWVENINSAPLETATGGESQQLINGEGQYQQNSTYYMLFDAHRDIIIESVNVFASGAADRTIAVIDGAGNTITSGTFFIPDGASTVNLNFTVPEGTGYGLRLIGSTPLLWRDKDLTNSFPYPYVIGNLATITGTNVSGTTTYGYYYYFYDWVVRTPELLCSSNRVEVIASVNQLNEGCTIFGACNYNPQAIIDDGSCTYPGCTNPDAINYDSSAGCSDGSCVCAELSPIFFDNFQSYIVNQGLAAQSSIWEYWSIGSITDGLIVNDYANSGTTSLKIEGLQTDLVLPIGPASTGAYTISFEMLLTTSGGYFNLQHIWSPNGTNYEWACDVFFDELGNATWITEGISGGTTTVPLFEWFNVTIEVDMDNDLGRLYIENLLLDTWQWSINNTTGTPGQNSLAALNFFGSNAASGNSTYYIDDVEVSLRSLVDCNSGCTNSNACNFDPLATINDGSCLVVGMTCNDLNPNTVNDAIQSDCQCAGVTVDPGCNGFSVINNSSNPTCAGLNNGFISVNASGTSAPFSYNWNNGSATSSINNIGPGTYTVLITDAVGCSEEISFTLTSPAALSASITTNASDCYGEASGAASATVSGGTAPYSYIWNTSPIQNTAQITNVPAGNYTVNIADANGCLYTSFATISQPAQPLVVTATTTSASCSQSDGSANAVVTGNTASIQYLWSNGQTGATATNLLAGTYTVTVSSGGCSAQATVNVNNTNAPVINHVSSSPECFGENTGSINTIITGGALPYQYLWSNGGSGTSQTGLSAGNYTFIVIDNVGCQASIAVTLTQPNPINIALASTPTSCTGTPQGALVAAVSGGTQPYLYLWSNGSGGTSLNNLSAGQYSLSITDANGCASEASAQVINPDGVIAYAVSSNVNCFGGNDGAIEIIVTDGTPPYTYEWNNGATATSSINGLTAGEYNCVVTDANGCTFSTNTIIEEPQANLPDILGMTNVDPFSIQTYSISSISGATLNWVVSGGNILSGQGTNFIQVQWSDSPVASISLLITYANGCQSVVNLQVQIGMNVSMINSAISWKVFPNPVIGDINVELSGTNESVTCHLRDISGRVIYIGKIKEGINNIDLSMLSGGIYTIEVVNPSIHMNPIRILKQ